MHIEDPVNGRGELILGLASISTENPNFEIASKKVKPGIFFFRRLSEPHQFKKKV
jgi:hypothetical protein